MSITGGLLALGVRYVLDVEVPFEVIEKRLTDHSQALPKALAKANDRAWQAVGLALAGDGLFDRVWDLFRDGDLKGVRDQIKQFLEQTPTGLESSNAGLRARAAEEWGRLRKAGRLSAATTSVAALARRAATLERHGDPARMSASALRVVKETAEAVRAEAPHLADLLTAAPTGGTPLLAAAFAFFFRRLLEDSPELFRGLSFEHLRQISERQERGLDLLDLRTSGILDQISVLFDALEAWFASLGRNVDEVRARLDKYDATMARLGDFLDRNEVPSSSSKPTTVSIASEQELQRLKAIRDALRSLPVGLLSAGDWTKLGQALRAAGLFGDAGTSDEAAAVAAKAAADRAAEAVAEHNRFKDACETGEWEKAAVALRRAVHLDRIEYQPFDWLRYDLVGVLGAGGFGTVFHCLDRFDIDPDTDRPTPVAIKTLHHDGLDRTVEAVFREASILKTLGHDSIIKIRGHDYAHKVDEKTRSRPYFVLEYFPGQTLEAYLEKHGKVAAADLPRLAHKVAVAVHAAHSRGVFHRDLKPANVLVARTADGGWDVRVIDFGLAVKVSAAARASMNVPSDRRASQDRSFAGTLDYAAPEQMGKLPGVTVGPYSDVFAFGKMCMQCLFGHTAAQDVDWEEEVLEPLRGGLKKVLNRCVRHHLDGKSPRFATFEPVIAELAALIGGPVAPPPPPPPVETPVHKVVPPHVPSRPPVETPVQKLKRIKAEVAAKTEQARAHMGRYEYGAAAQVLLDFTPEQSQFRDDDLLRDAVARRDRLQELDRDVQKLYRAHKFHDPRLPVLVKQYLVLKPDDAEMRELLEELPPPNEPPASPKAGDVCALRIVLPEVDHRPGEIVTVEIPPVDRGPKPGTLGALKWKPVPLRPSPHK